MRALNRSNWSDFGVVGLVLACTVGSSREVTGQTYYYDPGPEYYHNDTMSGTVLGGALGAITGAIAGGRKNGGEGAIIGAGIGAVSGNLLGRAQDQTDARQAAAGAAAVQQLNAQAAAAAVTNYDLVQMSQAGVSDDLIISTMRSSGVRLDLSPQGLISLKQQGVSDRVVLAAQNMPSRTSIMTPAPPVVVRRTVPVFVAPVPRYHHHHRPRYRSHPHSGIHFHYRAGF